jgi:hypothetical protein
MDVRDGMKNEERPMRAAMLPIAFVLACCWLTAFAEETPDEAQIRSWINELANSKPKRKYLTPDDRLTPEERKSLEPVEKAYNQLSNHFIAALPYLIESLGDERYSFPREHPSSGVFENQTVGAACRSIINRKLLIKNPIVADHRGIAVWYNLPIDKTWYSRVKQMTLFELQVDSMNWLLKQPSMHGVSKDTWEKELASVRAYRDEFVSKGKALDKTLSLNTRCELSM